LELAPLPLLPRRKTRKRRKRSLNPRRRSRKPLSPNLRKKTSAWICSADSFKPLSNHSSDKVFLLKYKKIFNSQKRFFLELSDNNLPIFILGQILANL